MLATALSSPPLDEAVVRRNPAIDAPASVANWRTFCATSKRRSLTASRCRRPAAQWDDPRRVSRDQQERQQVRLVGGQGRSASLRGCRSGLFGAGSPFNGAGNNGSHSVGLDVLSFVTIWRCRPRQSPDENRVRYRRNFATPLAWARQIPAILGQSAAAPAARGLSALSASTAAASFLGLFGQPSTRRSSQRPTIEVPTPTSSRVAEAGRPFASRRVCRGAASPVPGKKVRVES
jgi:hypothetical protein